jgi:serralysin
MKLRLTGAVLLALFTMLFVGAVPALAFDRSANEATMLQLVNHVRVSRGLHAVRIAGPLDQAALTHSRDMIAHDYFAHSSLSGATAATRARGAGYAVSGCSQWAVGEVIAWGVSARGIPQAVFKGWMRSSSHRRVILSSRWREVGIGCARGSFQGMSDVLMYTIDFGRRVQ